MSQKRRERKLGVFAIEGEWLSDLRGGLSFRPVLELLNKVNNAPYIHRDAAIRDELFYYLKKWTQKRYEKYPILYLVGVLKLGCGLFLLVWWMKF